MATRGLDRTERHGHGPRACDARWMDVQSSARRRAAPQRAPRWPLRWCARARGRALGSRRARASGSRPRVASNRGTRRVITGAGAWVRLKRNDKRRSVILIFTATARSRSSHAAQSVCKNASNALPYQRRSTKRPRKAPSQCVASVDNTRSGFAALRTVLDLHTRRTRRCS